MPWFKCVIQGENFPGALMQTEESLGFFITRVVEADSAQEAEFKAIFLLRAEPGFTLAPGHPGAEEARVMFESVEEIDEAQAASFSNEGASWFPMKTPELKH